MLEGETDEVSQARSKGAVLSSSIGIGLRPAPSPVTFLRWDVAVAALILAFVLAHLPKVLGQRYRRWGVLTR